MQQIKLISLEIENFRGLREFSLTPNAESISVVGANGTGKSTLSAAFLWLLTGKDMQGRDNYNIFPLDVNGQRVSGCVPTVTAVLSTDSQQLVLCRSISEKWTKKRGSAKQEYTGDETHYTINEVPVSATEFSHRIDSLVPEKRLPLLINAAWFSEQTKDYKERRRLLMEQFGQISAEDVFAACPDLQPLKILIGNHSVEEYEKICIDHRKRYKDALTSIPARIDENRKQLDDTPANIEQLKKNRAKINIEIAKLRYEIEHTDANSKRKKLNNQLEQIQQQLTLLATKQQTIKSTAAAEWNSQHMQKINIAMQSKNNAEVEYTQIQTKLTESNRRISELQEYREALRQEWSDISASEPTIYDVCPTCGQVLPSDQIQQAQEQYNAAKSEKLANIAARGHKAGNEIEQLAIHIKELATQQQDAAEQLSIQSHLLESLENETMPKIENPMLEQLDKQIETLHNEESSVTQQLAQTDNTNDTETEMLQQMNQMQAQSDALSVSLAEAERNAERLQRIEQLENEKRSTMQALEELERGIALCQDFTQKITNMLTECVNKHFPTVRFRLFEEQKNGGLREVCEATMDGVPYGALNTAAKMQTNIEVVKAFSSAMGVSMPIFLDNRESVTNLSVPNEMQVINLLVQPNTKLGLK